MTQNHRRVRFVLVISLLFSCGHLDGAGKKKPGPPDLTKGGKKDDKHDWQLGATGMRGWIYGSRLKTTASRQILVTKVDKGSPADGVMQVNDVILGVDGKPFSDDARISFGDAVTRAEASGVLKMLIWRDGRQSDVQIKVKPLGKYAETAPYDCAKSKQILEKCCEFISKTGLKGGGIPTKLNALALLASGDKKYLEQVKKYAHQIGPKDLKLKLHDNIGMVAWSWGYSNLFLTEYFLATGDEEVLPAIRTYSVTMAKGQSGVGTWGHGMAWPAPNGGVLHGPLGGYGAMNQSSLICHMSLVLAEKCGIRDPEVRKAVTLANQFFEFYINKGSIPYGDHRPGWNWHDDNGKCSSAAVMFDLQGNDRGGQFFAKMTTASYREREQGHTGNFFSILWGAMGANRGGPRASAAFMKQLRWYYDSARTWQGNFRYQGGAGAKDKYHNWDSTGAYALAYALPLRKIYITGRDMKRDLSAAVIEEVIRSGELHAAYEKKEGQELIKLLGSWSPVVRHRAATALSKKPDVTPEILINMLESEDMNKRYGACKALGALKAKAAPAVPALKKLLASDDVWLRIQACYALSDIGDAARSAVPKMLKLAVSNDQSDPRQFMQRYLCFTLFYPGGALRMRGLLARDVKGIDRELLYPAVERLLQNDDGRARGCIGTLYRHLSFEEIKPILPAILKSIETPAPSGVMFASGIRVRGLDFLAQHKIKEGMALCFKCLDIHRWGKKGRISGILNTLKKYGGAAKAVLPQMRQLEKDLLAHREAKSVLKPIIAQLQKLIKDVENAKDVPKLRSMKD